MISDCFPVKCRSFIGIDEASESEEESEEEKQNEEEAKEDEEEEEGKKTPVQLEKKKKKGTGTTWSPMIAYLNEVLRTRAVLDDTPSCLVWVVWICVSQTAAESQTAQTTVTSRERRPPPCSWWLACVCVAE